MYKNGFGFKLDCETMSGFKLNLVVLNSNFSSSRAVAIAKLKKLVCSTMNPLLEEEEMEE